MASQSPAMLIFDDGQGRFGPLTDRRAPFDFRLGPVTCRERIETALNIATVGLFVADRLADARRETEAHARVNDASVAAGTAALWINGRWTGGPPLLPPLDPARIRALPLNAALVQPDGAIVAAHLPADAAAAFVASGFTRLPGDARYETLDDTVLLARPWHLLDRLEATLAYDLARYPGPRVSPEAQVHPTAVLDDARGPIVVREEAVIGPLVVLEGPCYVGKGSVVQPHALIRANTVIGDFCKVAGEISFSLIHGYTNKAHAGYLGQAVVGEWVNLGADTTASNLKNTYGEVRMQIEEGRPAEGSGRQFLGPVIGDFVRTAIGTRIPTGACLGTGCMIATGGFAPKFAAPGGFYTEAGRQPYDADKLIETARAMMARRKVALTPAAEAVLRGNIHP